MFRTVPASVCCRSSLWASCLAQMQPWCPRMIGARCSVCLGYQHLIPFGGVHSSMYLEAYFSARGSRLVFPLSFCLDTLGFSTVPPLTRMWAGAHCRGCATATTLRGTPSSSSGRMTTSCASTGASAAAWAASSLTISTTGPRTRSVTHLCYSIMVQILSGLPEQAVRKHRYAGVTACDTP